MVTGSGILQAGGEPCRGTCAAGPHPQRSGMLPRWVAWPCLYSLVWPNLPAVHKAPACPDLWLVHVKECHLYFLESLQALLLAFC